MSCQVNEIIIKTQNEDSPPSDIGDRSRFWLYCIDPFVLLHPSAIKLFGFPIFRLRKKPEGYSRNASRALNLISTF